MKMRVVLLPLAALLVVGCGDGEQLAEEQLRPVRYVTVSNDNEFRSRSFSGTSKSTRESRRSFKVPGTIVSLPAQIGQRLAAGDLIAEIDSATYVLQTQQAQASLLEAQANDRRATANYDRTKGLYANDNASLNDLESSRAQAESARALVASANKALEIARLNTSFTKLRADTDCSIASLDVEVNENVSAGQQVAAVSCGEEFEVNLDIPESVIASVRESMPVSVSFGAIPNQVFSGTISEVSVASTGSAGFPIVVKIDGSYSALRSGLAANVTFQFDSATGSGGVVLPVSAVVNDPTGTFVFVADAGEVDGETIVRRRGVTLGELSQSGIEIIDGLNVGDRVVTAGTSVIRDGQRALLSAAE